MFRSPSSGRFEFATAAPADSVPVHDPPLSPHDEAVFLLNLAAEIEHSLMVQYLFATYSLRPAGQFPPDKAALVRGWKRTIARVAREEMGHLVTVQNLLRSLGASLSLARDEFPLNTGFYPFDFTLEPLTKNSTAKYAFAEMPPENLVTGIDGVTPAEIADIIRRANTDNARNPVNRVGKLYDQLMTIIESLPASEFSAPSVSHQAKFDEWGLDEDDLLILPISNRDDAIAALQRIAEQGEGPITAGAAADPNSHFQQFLGIYRHIPEAGDWEPAFPIIANPNVRTDTNPGQITQPEARLWAQLLNVRYRRLLITLRHALEIEAASPAGTATTSRGLLISWTFSEMYNIRSISEILVSLPATSSAGENRTAGAPFEMPSSLSLPTAEADRWRLQASILQSADVVVNSLIALPSTHADFLNGMITSDSEAIHIASHVGGN